MCVDELLGRGHPPEVFVMFRELEICAHTSRSPRTITGRPDAVDFDAVPFVATLGCFPRLLARVRVAGTTHRLNTNLHIRARSQLMTVRGHFEKRIATFARLFQCN